MHDIKILCITPIEHIPNIKNSLKKIGNLTIIDDPSPEDLKDISTDFEVIFTNPNKSKIYIGSDLFSNWTNLKCVCTASTGTVHIDKDFLNEKGIKLISLTEEYEVLKSISSTAEHAFLLMVASLRNLISASDSVKRDEWNYEPYVGRQLNKLKICIFGFGRLGSIFANYCKAFGAQVYIYDPYKEIPDEFIELKNLPNDLKKMDVISIHMHVTEETKNFFNEDLFKKFKNDVLIINTARGELIDENHLINFLKKNKKSKIASDVLSGEIFGFQNSELFNFSKSSNQVLLTPHIGGMTIDAQEIAYGHAVKLLEEFLKN